MVVDSIKKLILYFSSSKVFSKSDDGGSIDTTTTATMSTAIASSDEEEQSLYTIVENSLKDNVSKCDVIYERGFNIGNGAHHIFILL